MTIDVSECEYTAKLVRAMCQLNAVTVPGEFRVQLNGVLTEMAWELADERSHPDFAGNAVTYKADGYGVRIRIDQFPSGVRHVERKITWATVIYGD